MPSLPTNLSKVGSVYKFRARVPQDLLAHYAPKKEIVVSLRTKSLAEARRLLPQVQQRHFEEWDRIRGTGTKPQAVTISAQEAGRSASSINWRDPAAAWQLNPSTGRKELIVKDHPITDELIGFLTSLFKHDSLACDEARRLDGSYTLEEIQEHRENLTKTTAIIRDMVSTGDTGRLSQAAIQLLALRGINPVGEPEDFQRLYLAFARASLQTNESLLKQMNGEVVERPPVIYPEDKKTAGVTLYSLFEYWRDLVPGRPRGTVEVVERCVRAFGEFTKHKGADQLARADIVAYRDLLISQGKAPATVEKLLSLIRTVLQQAFESERIASNPAASVRVPRGKTATTKKRNLEVADLQALFGSVIYTANERPKAGAGDAAAWVPLIALYTGARLEEICQLQVSDLKDDGEIKYFSIQPDDQVEGGGQKTLKNDASRRNVPIHHKLIKAGLLNYVAELKEVGATWLFPKLVPDSYGKRSGNFSKWWTRWRASQGVGGSHRCFHAFRHLFKTACRAAGLSEETHDAITGHSGGGVGRSYGSVPLKATHTAIQQVEFEGLSFDWVWKPMPKPKSRWLREAGRSAA